ncbi:MAG: TIGR00730 family Rossman fold protein [Geodermatophilaceae bacterium]|nr:TIGR00730 family Rossman fold protein [Geodermatophilaceae bacterium]
MSAICVFCASATGIDPAHLELAAAVGREIARRGHSLVSGGGCVSMMGAVAGAARAGGALTAGVIPRWLVELEVADRDADELVVVDTMRQRKAEMDRRSDAFLVLPGGLGTLEELFEIWTTRSLDMHDKPVVLLDPTGVFDPLWTVLADLVRQGFVRTQAFDAVAVTRDVDSAFAALTLPR